MSTVSIVELSTVEYSSFHGSIVEYGEHRTIVSIVEYSDNSEYSEYSEYS